MRIKKSSEFEKEEAEQVRRNGEKMKNVVQAAMSKTSERLSMILVDKSSWLTGREVLYTRGQNKIPDRAKT